MGLKKTFQKLSLSWRKQWTRLWLNPSLLISHLHCNVQCLHSVYCFSQHSVPQGFVPAINALAWYYEQFEQDYKQAVQLWERADLLECPDAALNLGVVHSQGLYPGKAADQVSSSVIIYLHANRVVPSPWRWLFCLFFCLTVYGLSVLSEVCRERARQGSGSPRRHLDHWDTRPRQQTSFRCCFVSHFPFLLISLDICGFSSRHDLNASWLTAGG